MDTKTKPTCFICDEKAVYLVDYFAEDSEGGGGYLSNYFCLKHYEELKQRPECNVEYVEELD